MGALLLWFLRPVWVFLLALPLAFLGVHGSPELVCISAAVSSVSFLWVLIYISRLDCPAGSMVKQYAVSFDRLRYVCMSFLWKDHLTGVLAPVVCWAVLCLFGCTSLVLGRKELDLSLVVFLLHLLSICYQTYIGKTLQSVVMDFYSQSNRV